MREYKDLLATVSEIEQSSPKPTVNFVEMEIGSGDSLSTDTPRSYAALLDEVSSFGAGFQPARQKKAQPTEPAPKPVPAAPKAPAPTTPSIQPTEAAPREARSMFSFRQPGSKEMPGVIPPMAAQRAKPYVPPKPVQQPKPLEASASEELTRTMKAAEIKPPAPVQQVQAQKATGLVLPTLSLADQVEELDKIVASLKQRLFNSDQMVIVKEEVEGLSDVLSSGPQPAPPGSPFEQDLMALRKARLAEALALIKGL